MGNPLWFTRTLDIGESVPRPGQPAVPLIEYIIGTNFRVVTDRVLVLHVLGWVEYAERRNRHSVQLIVRVPDLPAALATPEGLKQYLLRVLRGN